MTIRIGNTTIGLIRGDLTLFKADALVNAANSTLLGGGGVDGALHRAGGPSILAECRSIVDRIGSLPPGEAVSTTAGKLKAKRLIHTVGPIWRGGKTGEEQTLANAYRSSLALAQKEGLRTIGFPSISTGVYGYPVDRAATTAIGAVAAFVAENPGAFDEITFVLFSDADLETYRSAIRDYLKVFGNSQLIESGNQDA